MSRLVDFSGLLCCVVLFSTCTAFWNKDEKEEPLNNTNNSICVEGERTCLDNTIGECINNAWQVVTICGENGLPPVCNNNEGSPACADCMSLGTTCRDNNVYQCDASGEVGQMVEECSSDHNEICVEGSGAAQCDAPCIREAINKSHRGCEHWLVSTPSPKLEEAFHGDFSLLIDNANTLPVQVAIEGPGISLVEEVPPRTTRHLMLPHNLDLLLAGAQNQEGPFLSGIYRAASGSGAIHVESTLPVAIYQFSPLSLEQGDATTTLHEASLVLPVSLYGQRYFALSLPTTAYVEGTQKVIFPGFATVVAIEDDTTVAINTRAHIAQGLDVSPLQPGDNASFLLNRGDVLQLISSQNVDPSNCPGDTFQSGGATQLLICDASDSYDLTGTEILSNNPVALYSGHAYACSPVDSLPGSHMEEMLMPNEAWGYRFIVSSTMLVAPESHIPSRVKVLAGEDDTTLTFLPEIMAPVTLQKGESIELDTAGFPHFSIDASNPILVTRFLVPPSSFSPGSDMGGAAMGQIPPLFHYRTSYRFTSPESMTHNYLLLIAPQQYPESVEIFLDGVLVPRSLFAVVEGQDYGIAHIELLDSQEGGTHEITTTGDMIHLGVELYGHAQGTSYHHLAGFFLNQETPPI
ncbi:IgGFc-binding protein [Myxococcota bacterium]|nr:IgGFc-binding protein [Myxococcota bacterium]